MDKKKALESIAKRPKLFGAMQKGGTIPQLKVAGGCSGGYIRSLVKAGIAEINDGIVKITVNKSNLPKAEAIKETSKPKKEKAGEKAERVVKGTTVLTQRKSRKERKAEEKSKRFVTLTKNIKGQPRLISGRKIALLPDGKQWYYEGPYSGFNPVVISKDSFVDRETFFN